MQLKIIALLCILLGEAFAILGEIFAARWIELAPDNFFTIFFKTFALVTLGGGFLVLGYMFGVSSLRSVWVVAVASITSILVVEPLVIWVVFHEIPSKGALAGMVLGILGLIFAIFY